MFVEQYVANHQDKLTFHGSEEHGMLECEITRTPHQHNHKYNVHFLLKPRSKSILSSKHEGFDLPSTLEKAFNALHNQIKNTLERKKPNYHKHHKTLSDYSSILDAQEDSHEEKFLDLKHETLTLIVDNTKRNELRKT
jgi:predicted restriction endonuclease